MVLEGGSLEALGLLEIGIIWHYSVEMCGYWVSVAVFRGHQLLFYDFLVRIHRKRILNWCLFVQKVLCCYCLRFSTLLYRTKWEFCKIRKNTLVSRFNFH